MAVKLSDEYKMTYYDPKVHAKWKARFGTELSLLMDAMFIRNLLRTTGKKYTPLLVLFNGNPDELPEESELQLSPIFHKPKDKYSLFDRIFRKRFSEGYLFIIIYAKTS